MIGGLHGCLYNRNVLQSQRSLKGLGGYFGVGIINVGVLRFYAVTRSKKSQKPQRNPLFQFGKFSRLTAPTKKEIDINGKAIEKIDSFDELRIFPSVRVAMIEEIKHSYNLKSTYIKSKDDLQIKPTPVQVAAIRKINQVRNSNANKKKDKFQESKDIFNDLISTNDSNKLKVFTVAAETGSGKTWSYLASILSKLKDDDLDRFNRGRKHYVDAKSSSTIRSVILLPTHELVEQVYQTLKSANKLPLNLESNVNPLILNNKTYRDFLKIPEESDTLNLNILKWGAGDPALKFFNSCKDKRLDVLVTTPTKLQSLGKQLGDENPFRMLYNVQYCVVDEADTLFDFSWINDTTSVLQKLSKCRDLILCSATIPQKFSNTVEKMFANQTIDIITPSLHKLPKQIVLKVIDSELSPYNGSKPRCLAQALYAIQKDGTESGFTKRIIVFVNQKRDVLPLANLLVLKYHRSEEDVIGLSGDDSPLERASKIAPFIKPAEPVPEGESKIKVLITTDLYARGINFSGVKNVILMDFPNSSVDLVHRLGRTGRMKQSGRVFIITDKKTRKTWIKSLPNVTKQGIRIG